MDNPFSVNVFKKLPKPALYAVIVGGVFAVGYAEYAHHKSTGSWSPFASTPVTATTPDSGIDPLTQLPYADDSVIDPVTNLQYLAEAEQYGSVATAEASVSQYGQSTATGSGIGVNPASPISSGSVNTAVGTSIYTSNAAWAQAVEVGLSGISGSTSYDGTDIGTAIGAYLQGEPVTPAQASVISVAIAEYGNPPVGFFQIIAANSTPTGTTTGSAPSGPVTPTVSNGAVASVNATGAVLTWTGTGATSYRVQLTGPGSEDGRVSTVYIPKATYSGLESGHNYSVSVQPLVNGKSVGTPGTIDFKTK